MAQQGAVEQMIIDFIRNQIAATPDLEIDPDDNLFTSGQVDSLGIMRLITHLETTLELEIPLIERVPENFRSVRVMAAYLGDRLATRS